MHDESHFLRVIAQQPEDDSLRLVYADWLEEQGDVRAEYLRAEYRLRVEGVDDDGLLDRLRPQFEKAWLRAVHDGFLGDDWSLVWRSVSETAPRIGAQLGLFDDDGRVTAESLRLQMPFELATLRRYWEAHRLRRAYAGLGYCTVEFRPAFGNVVD